MSVKMKISLIDAEKKIKRISSYWMFLCVWVVFCFFPLAVHAEEKTYQNYVNILYNSENGLPTSEANDIVQTSDGFIWIASYSGLIRYDGNTFERITDTDGVASANTLFIDSKDRLWVGTNDNGIMLYDDGGNYTTYNSNNGLPSNSVKSIVEDSKGNLYIGTTAGICYLDIDKEKIEIISSNNVQNTYINSMVILSDDTVICVTGTGEVFSVIENDKEKEIVELKWNTDKQLKTIVSVSTDSEQKRWIFGTEDNEIYICKGTVNNFTYQIYHCGRLKQINYVRYIQDGTLWICSDQGVGYISTDGDLHELWEFKLNNSVDRMIQDYEGNLWFTSSRQGVFKCTQNYFVDINKSAGLGETVVNSTMTYKNNVYAATDTGLFIFDADNHRIENKLTNYLKGIRIRCLLVDKNERLWLCTYGDKGLVIFDGSSYTSIGEEQGINTSKIRLAIEGIDGSIIVATANGIYLVKNQKVVSHLGEKQGLTNLEILSLCQLKDGTIYAGTDGGGVCIIREGKVVQTITEKDGLRSGIVMRIRYDEQLDGFWLITSNSIAFYHNSTVTTIDKFPYSNNFDLYFGKNDMLWILSSNGLYVVQKETMLSKKTLMYSFYDYNSGMPSTPTANSFSYMDEQANKIYICGSTGLYSMQMNLEEKSDAEAKLAIPNVVVDGEKQSAIDGNVHILADAKRIKICAYALCYGLQNPLIEYYIDGFDKEKEVVRKSELGDIVYTNLNGGEYSFHFSILDSNTGKILSTKTLRMTKEYHFTERKCFPFAVIFIGGIFLAAILYIVLKFRMNHVMLKKEEAQKKILSDALDMAKSANEAKTQFLSRISHDIRTPMNAVIGISRLGIEECREEHALDYFEKINSSGTYLLGLINDVLDMSRIESGKVEFRDDCIDRKAFYQNVITMLHPLLEEKKIELKCDFSHLQVDYVYCDKVRMEQIYMNILSNAIKYSPVGSKVEWLSTDIEIQEDKIYYKVVIRDYGCGMSEEFLTHIFEPFAQEKNPFSGQVASTGLGLAICKNIIDQMGGNIKVKSKVGEGSTFTLFLSNVVSKEAPKQGKNQDKEQNNLIGRRVLLAEDHPLNMEIAKKILEKKKIEVTGARDGKEALDLFEKSKEGYYHAILMDIRMPQMDGLEATKAIRELKRKDAKIIPIIAMTANAYDEDKKTSKQAGMNAHLSKPINTNEMYETLEGLIK